ncbi:MAG TPA: hypothetical protein VFK30_05265, partial [Anaerolineae bacterium]|nr:hypothetical protein [Anaerolineae bacterium]
YTLIYTNPPDGVFADGVVLTDVLPANVTYLGSIGSPAPTYNSSPPYVRWNIGSLSPGITRTVGLVIQINNNFTQWPDGSSVDNMAQLKATGRSLVRSNFGTADSAPVRYRFVLWMDQSVNATKAGPGSLLTYTTRLTNVTSMPINLTGLTVYANLDPRPSPLSFTGTYVLNCVGSCQGWHLYQVNPLYNQLVYTRSLPILGPNQSTVISLVARISSTLPAGVLGVENLACASTDGIHGVQLDATRSCADTITTVAGPDIAVLGIRTPQLTAPNHATRFWVNVTNQGFDKTLGPDGRGWFGVDLYVKPVGSDAPFGPYDRQWGYCDKNTYNFPCSIQATHYATVNFTTTLGAGGLVANASLSVPFTITIATPGLYWLYAQADPFWAADGFSSPVFGTYQDGRIMEADEHNNIFGPVLINVGSIKVYLPLVRKNS